MKKQTKSSKHRSAKTMTQVVVTHSRRQRVLGIIGLIGLFLCGLFVGMSIGTSPRNVALNTMVVQSDEKLITIKQPADVCTEVERLLSRRLPSALDDADNRIERAKIYASLAERGCPENYERYVELASQELEIARAIEDDEFDHGETIEVVETYKRLHMQAAAQEILDKAKKITNPAIDFIIELEKIINE